MYSLLGISCSLEFCWWSMWRICSVSDFLVHLCFFSGAFLSFVFISLLHNKIIHLGNVYQSFANFDLYSADAVREFYILGLLQPVLSYY